MPCLRLGATSGGDKVPFFRALFRPPPGPTPNPSESPTGTLSPSGTLIKKSFALLDASSSFIRKSTVPERRASEEFLKVLERPQVLSDSHQNDFQRKADKIITNVFFNKERKQKTEAVLKDKVAAFQKVKGDKR